MEIIDANTVFGPSPRVTANLSIDRLESAATIHGLSKAIAISSVGVYHSYGDGNADTLKQCQGKDWCLPAATIDPRGYFSGMKIIPNLVSQGFRLFRFFPTTQGWPLDHAVFEDILEELEPTSIPVMINAGRAGDASALGRILGSKRNPLILEGVTFETMAEVVSVMKKHANMYAETHGIVVPSGLRFLADQVGGDRIIFGSFCPCSSLAGAIKNVEESGLSDEDKAKALSGNMKRLLGG